MAGLSVSQRYSLLRAGYVPSGRELSDIARNHCPETSRPFTRTNSEGEIRSFYIASMQPTSRYIPRRSLQIDTDGHILFLDHLVPMQVNVNCLEGTLVNTWKTLQRIATHAQDDIYGCAASVKLLGERSVVEKALKVFNRNTDRISESVKNAVPASQFDLSRGYMRPHKGVCVATIYADMAGEIQKIKRRARA